jgi:hypothetical protein
MGARSRHSVALLAAMAFASSAHPARASGTACPGAPLPPGFELIQSASVDLDGDGTPECVTLALKAAGPSDGRVPSGDLLLQVARSARGVTSTIGSLEMSGRPEHFVVARLAGAAHCGGSCSGMELHVVRVGAGGWETLFEAEQVQRGRVVITRGGRMEVYEGLYGLGEAPSFTVSSYEARGGKMARVAQRQEASGRAIGDVGSIRLEQEAR